MMDLAEHRIGIFFASSKAFLCIMTFLIIYQLLSYLHSHRLVRKSIENVYGRLSMASEKREQGRKALKALYGSYGKRNMLTHLDDEIRYSGIQTRLPWMTAELYVTVLAVATGAVMIMAVLLTGKFYLGMAFALCTVILSEYALDRMRRRRYELVEEELLLFINSVDTFSMTYDELITILEKSAGYLKGPLRDEIAHATGRARGQGNASQVLRELEDGIEHPFFKTFIRNLEISSRHSANYGEIVDECRNLLQVQLENSKKLENIYSAARFKIAGVTLGGAVCVLLMGTMIVGCTPAEYVQMLYSTGVGRLLMFITILVIAVAAYFSLIKSGRRD